MTDASPTPSDQTPADPTRPDETPAAASAPETVEPSLVRAVLNQRRALLLAAGLVVATAWISIPLGRWQGGLFLAVGIALGAVNHVLTEHVLQKVLASGELVTKQAYAASSMLRLVGISVVAVALAVFFWPHGAAVLFGLALFHLIALVLTGIPLLREVRKA